MRVTRRFWAALALSGFLAALAAILERPLLLSGSVLIGAWILAAQYSFLAALERTTRTMSVTQSPASSSVRTDSSMAVTLAVTLAEPVPLHLGIEAGLPVATTGDSLHVAVTPETTSSEQTASVTWPVAGRQQFSAPRLTATDGLFVATFPTGDRPTVTVEPRGPRRIHVGEGGTRLASAAGEHTSAQHGSGIELAEIREYTPGDATRRIDWKATARLGTPHVREHETDTDQRTLLVVDHRSSLATGPPNETKLDYLRNVMLATARNAHDLTDPIGLLGIGDGGTTTYLEPATALDSYTTIRRELLELEPSSIDAQHSENAHLSRSNAAVMQSPHESPTLRTVRRSASDLDEFETASGSFGQILRPFYADQQPYRWRIREQPLFNSVRTALASNSEAVWMAVFTDDSNPTELRETVSLARQNGAAVTIFLAPTVLYDSQAAGDRERMRNQYLEFETLRRELAGMDRVRALEVGPRDRLSTILEAGRDGDRQ
ncbi:DUF58 domain-containing protein [Natrialba sp. PRR66]|uniref:DUF58 domain-containing protein n=1 Tax=Natrialba sp. PRR66 TaxID=3098146 RepID=UPI002B1DB5B4|nr:DUF58 domain-containing protein [Natrialba sp. PRR66]